jgi:hypothetical protein
MMSDAQRVSAVWTQSDKGYKEFDAAHRPDGWNVWATFVISPAEEKKPPESKRPRIVK